MTCSTKISFEYIILHNVSLSPKMLLRIINLKNNQYNVNVLQKTNKSHKIADYSKLLNWLFVRDVIEQSTSTTLFQELLNQMRDKYQHNTSHDTQITVTLN